MALIKLSYLNPNLVIADHHHRPSPGNSPLSRSTVSRVDGYRLFSTCSRGVVTPVPLRAVINCRGSLPQWVYERPISPVLFRLMKIQSDIKEFSHPFYVWPTNTKPEYPGLDYEHWVIVMEKKPCGENANKQQVIDFYIQTLAKIVGSEEEAKRKIYNVSCGMYYGFGCEIDEETSKKLEELPGVEFALPDVYLDPEYKDYGGAELFVNGEIVPRSPERQRKIVALLREFCLDHLPFLFRSVF